MSENKEFSEQELVALEALQAGLKLASGDRVSINYIRRFRRLRIQTKNSLETCTVNIAFGFRHRTFDERGKAVATVKLERVLVTDASQLCHHFLAWVPVSVDIGVHEGLNLVFALSGHHAPLKDATTGRLWLLAVHHVYSMHDNTGRQDDIV